MPHQHAQSSVHGECSCSVLYAGKRCFNKFIDLWPLLVGHDKKACGQEAIEKRHVVKTATELAGA